MFKVQIPNYKSAENDWWNGNFDKMRITEIITPQRGIIICSEEWGPVLKVYQFIQVEWI